MIWVYTSTHSFTPVFNIQILMQHSTTWFPMDSSPSNSPFKLRKLKVISALPSSWLSACSLLLSCNIIHMTLYSAQWLESVTQWGILSYVHGNLPMLATLSINHIGLSNLLANYSQVSQILAGPSILLASDLQMTLSDLQIFQCPQWKSSCLVIILKHLLLVMKLDLDNHRNRHACTLMHTNYITGMPCLHAFACLWHANFCKSITMETTACM